MLEACGQEWMHLKIDKMKFIIFKNNKTEDKFFMDWW